MIVAYHSADFSFEEWALEAPLFYSSTSVIGEKDEGNEGEDMGDVWNKFYSQQGCTAYQKRRYLVEEFKSYLSGSQPLKIMDVGAGVGATASTLLDCCPISRYVCTDCSQVALDFLRERLTKMKYFEKCSTRVWDITSHPWPNESEIGEMGTSFDICMCIFTLSAIRPSLHKVAVQNLASTLSRGGCILFRDYAIHDLTMYRHAKCCSVEKNLYRRQDGTFAHYFSKEILEELVSSIEGLLLEEIEYACVINTNRKTKQELRRVFLHAVIRKQS